MRRPRAIRLYNSTLATRTTPISSPTILAPAPVEPAEAGTRLDKWLSRHLPDLSRTRLKTLIEEGCVSSEGDTLTDPSARVKPGRTILVHLPPDIPAEPEPQAIDLAVVYEDDHLIVIDKPAGLVVHPAAGNPDHTLVNALLAHCGESLSGIGGVRRPGIVHRLDKDTSGLMVAAKTDRAHQALARQFAEHSIDRAYRALVWGRPQPATGEIQGNIGRSPTNRKCMAIVKSGGKPALTRYRVLAVYGGGAIAQVECRLATGRTHQIRVHMTAIGHPLIGDPTYGRPRADRLKALSAEAKSLVTAFPRQALHAWKLGFLHPETGEMLRFESKIPSDINALIRFLDTM